MFSQINTVENLIEDLCSKLRELEKEENSEEEDLNETPISINKLDQADPAKRYYNAFPALSKDMEDSVEIIKNSCKSLAWPKTSQKQQLKPKSVIENPNRQKKIQQEELKVALEIVEKQQLSSIDNTAAEPKRKQKQRRRNPGLFDSRKLHCTIF